MNHTSQEIHHAQSAKIIDGRTLSANLMGQIKSLTQEFVREGHQRPGLAVILVGDDPASQVYVRNKQKRAQACGFYAKEYTFSAETQEETLLTLIARLNEDTAIHGILVQLPLPPSLSAHNIIRHIAPEKDVDGLHPLNAGLLVTGDLDHALVPCTPLGCLMMLQSVLKNTFSGKTALVIGRSPLVGKPMAHLLLQQDCTVTLAHSKTERLPEVTRGADIVVAAVGRPEFVRGDWIKPGAVVIDVGINRVTSATDRTLVGDVAFAEVSKVASALTPVPGGVGQMTTAVLMANTLKAAARQQNVEMTPVLEI